MHFTERASISHQCILAQYALEAAFRRLEQGRLAALERDLRIIAKYLRAVEDGLEFRPTGGGSLPSNVVPISGAV